jgi:hypothetical protein
MQAGRGKGRRADKQAEIRYEEQTSKQRKRKEGKQAGTGKGS